MTTPREPLLNRDSRRRRAERLADWLMDPADDWLLAAPFDPVSHVAHYQNLPADILNRLHSVEHVIDPATGRQGRRLMPLWLGGCGGYAVPAGLSPLVDQAMACMAGHRVERAVPDTAAFNGVADPLVSATLAAHGRAVVRLGAGARAACVIAGLVTSFPDQRVAVVVSRRRDGGHLAKQLGGLGVEARTFHEFAISSCPAPRVAVGTAAGLASPAAAYPHCGVVVVVDPVAFCGPGGVGLRTDQTLVTARWLALLPAGRQLSPLERDVVTAFFGAFWFHLPAHGHVRRRVLFTTQRFTLPAGGGAERRVMRLAGEMAAGGTTTRPSRFDVVQRVAGLARGPVVVLAHDDHHRRRLLRAQRHADRGQVAVITPNELTDLTELGGLVRADHREGRPPLPDHLLVELQTDRKPLVVVDALPPDDGGLGQRRAVVYRAAGWVPIEAELGGYAEWDAWLNRRLPGSDGRRAKEE